jgi:hypothetical protein
MITFFTTPKPFSGNLKTTQTNAISSWAALRPSCEVIIFGNEEGASELAADLGIRHVPDVERNEFGTPLISSMFKIAQETAGNKLMCYVNADIILMNDFLKAAQRIKKKDFLMIGQRWDIELEESLDFQKTGWDVDLKNRVYKEGRLHGFSGIDYFVFPRGLYKDLPPLAVGRAGWDNWLIYYTRSRKIPVIDATASIMVIHQNHGHADHKGGEQGFWKGPEALRNVQIGGGSDKAFSMEYATAFLTPAGLKPALSPRSIYFRLRAFPALHKRLRFFLVFFKFFEKRILRIKGNVNISM